MKKIHFVQKKYFTKKFSRDDIYFNAYILSWVRLR